MSKRIPLAILPVALLIFLLAGIATAQASARNSSTAAAPIPPQIGAAKKVFITNAGWDCLTLEGVFHGGPDRTYDEFYSAIRQWGRYQPVSAPEQADLDFEIRFACPPAAANVMNGGSVPPEYDPKVILTITQPKGKTVIWRIVQPVRPSKPPKFRIGTYRDQDLSDTIVALVNELKALAVRSSVPAPHSSSTP